MTQITIRKLDAAVRLKLKTRAAAKGRSLEAELREILNRAAAETPLKRNMARETRDLFAKISGVELKLPQRVKDRPVPDFKK
jgi:antitoxin FitA